MPCAFGKAWAAFLLARSPGNDSREGWQPTPAANRDEIAGLLRNKTNRRGTKLSFSTKKLPAACASPVHENGRLQGNVVLAFNLQRFCLEVA